LCSTSCAVRCVQSSSLLLLPASTCSFSTSALWHLCCLVPLLFGTSVIWRRWRRTLLEVCGNVSNMYENLHKIAVCALMLQK